MMVRSFRINVEPRAVEDLRSRIGLTRWPQGVTDSGGIGHDTLKRLVDRWNSDFDWEEQQRRLNTFEHVLVDVDQTYVHACRIRSAHANGSAILLLHGWPGSFVELLPIGTKLASRFDVVIPSIPGFGFSAIPDAPGISNAVIGDGMVGLMLTLGYEEFYVHGGDIGAGVASWMALKHPNRIKALHLNFIPGSYWPEPAANLTPEEEDFLNRRRQWSDRFGAYNAIQTTTPLTAAYGLSDSPVGLAAWVIEKFILWSDPASIIDEDTLLANLSIYWFTNTVASSMRYYLESAATPLRMNRERRVAVATDIAQFPYEMPFPPRSWVDRGYAVRRWTHMARGGHFAALEATDLLAADILHLQ